MHSIGVEPPQPHVPPGRQISPAGPPVQSALVQHSGEQVVPPLQLFQPAGHAHVPPWHVFPPVQSGLPQHCWHVLPQSLVPAGQPQVPLV